MKRNLAIVPSGRNSIEPELTLVYSSIAWDRCVFMGIPQRILRSQQKDSE